MPEGDTLYRVAAVMRRALGADEIVAARGRPGGAQLERIVGAHVSAVRTYGKHLLIDFDDGLTLHTHLQMNGSWHRYRPGESWRAPAADAVAVLQTTRAVAVCFEAPTVELIETRALGMHPVLSRLGPDLLDPGLDIDEASRRLRAAPTTVAEALLDQRVIAGIGNVYRSEVLAHTMTPPFTPASDLTLEQAHRLLATAAEMLRANLDGRVRATVPGARRGERWAYRRAGRPCRRCGTAIRTTSIGQPPRRLYWCSTCQRSHL
jgi:endonuclease-8